MESYEQYLERVRDEHEAKRANGEILISAGMMVRNCEEWIAKTLDSIRDKVDEIVVLVDTRSDDKTREICVSFGCYVIDYEWVKDDFSATRRASVDACAGKWVLIIDGDETLECENDALRELL